MTHVSQAVRLHGTGVMLAMPLLICSMHKESHCTNAFLPYGALQMSNVIFSLFMGPKIESSTCRCKKSVTQELCFTEAPSETLSEGSQVV